MTGTAGARVKRLTISKRRQSLSNPQHKNIPFQMIQNEAMIQKQQQSLFCRRQADCMPYVLYSAMGLPTLGVTMFNARFMFGALFARSSGRRLETHPGRRALHRLGPMIAHDQRDPSCRAEAVDAKAQRVYHSCCEYDFHVPTSGRIWPLHRKKRSRRLGDPHLACSWCLLQASAEHLHHPTSDITGRHRWRLSQTYLM